MKFITLSLVQWWHQLHPTWVLLRMYWLCQFLAHRILTTPIPPVSINSSNLFLRNLCHDCCLLVLDTILVQPRVERNARIAEYPCNYCNLLDPDYILISCLSAMLILYPPSVNFSDDVSTKLWLLCFCNVQILGIAS